MADPAIAARGLNRRGRTVKGRLLAALLHLSGRPVFCGDLRKALAGLAAA